MFSQGPYVNMPNNQITAIKRWLQLKHSFSFQSGNVIESFFVHCDISDVVKFKTLMPDLDMALLNNV